MQEGPSQTLPNEILNSVDKDQYHDPEYLGLVRWAGAQLLLQTPLHENQDVVKSIYNAGVDDKGILFDDEIGQIQRGGFEFPQPWSSAEALTGIPDKMEDLLGLFNITVPGLAEKGYIIGLTSGKFDIFGPRYSYYLQECKRYCHYLTVGVDGNDMINQEGRPYNDFPVRASSVCGLSCVDSVFKISKAVTMLDAMVRPLPTFYYPALGDPSINILQAFEIMEKWKQKNPFWYEHIGPQLRFFYTDGDPATLAKEVQAIILGAKTIIIPKATDVTSTDIGNHFGVKKRQDQKDNFGIPSKYIRGYLNGDF